MGIIEELSSGGCTTKNLVRACELYNVSGTNMFQRHVIHYYTAIRNIIQHNTVFKTTYTNYIQLCTTYFDTAMNCGD